MSQTQTPDQPETLDLSLDVETIRQEVVPAEGAGDGSDQELEQKAETYANQLIALDGDAGTDEAAAQAAVEDLGRVLQREAARRSKMLQQPIKSLSERGSDGGPVANALIDLKTQVESLDPARFDFSPGWLSRTLGHLPGIGGPLKRYFSRYESAQTVIDAIILSLDKGREQLERDNITLQEDQKAMRELTHKLERQIALGRALDGKLAYKLEREVPPGDPRQKFVKEELLFPLRQRITDLQQQLAVNQQGVISIAIIMQNNKELIRGVNRAIDVTVSALQVAVTVALALANQKIVLDKISALNTTTSNLIAGTAERLKTQGTEIAKQAGSAMLDLEALKSAFTDINAALDQISHYRQSALPKMAQTIVEFDRLTAAGETAIKQLEEGADKRPALKIVAD